MGLAQCTQSGDRQETSEVAPAHARVIGRGVRFELLAARERADYHRIEAGVRSACFRDYSKAPSERNVSRASVPTYWKHAQS